MSDTVIVPDDGISSDLRHPRLGYRCIPHDNADAVITADSTATGYAPANPFNWLPSDYWKPATGGEHYIDVTVPQPQAVDFFAGAQHTLADEQGTIGLRYTQDGGGTWVNAFQPFQPASRSPFWVDIDPFLAKRWQIYTNSVNPAVLGVIAFGTKYRPYRGQFSGFMPPGMARSFDLYASSSETGNFLGRSILRKKLKGSIAFDLMEISDAYGDWVPFMQAAERHAFFLAWMLDDWPADVQFVQTDGDWTPPAMTQFGYIGTQINYVGLLQE